MAVGERCLLRVKGKKAGVQVATSVRFVHCEGRLQSRWW